MAVAESPDDGSCSICYDLVGDDPVGILQHVLDEHSYHEEFFEFIQQVVVGRYCSICRAWFRSDVELSGNRLFKIRPVCPDCREEHPAWENLRTDSLTVRELVEKGWIPDPEDSEK